MSNLEHLIENGLCLLDEGKSYIEWRELMQQDCNWAGNENITLDNLWEICQYVIFTWNYEQTARIQIKPTINEHGEAYCVCGENVGIIPNSKNLPKIRSKYCKET